MTRHIPPDWDKLISGYLTELRAAGRPETTVGLRRAQLDYLAQHMPVGPQLVTRDMLVGFAAAQSWAPETRLGLVQDTPRTRLPKIIQKR